jgi:hypothetical protein
VSLTLSIGAGVSHWTYMAALLAERLARVIAAREIRSDDIPLAARSDAEKFFTLARAGAGESLSENASASISAFVIASDVLRMTERSALESRKEVLRHLDEFDTFLKQVEEPRTLTGRELSVAEKLQNFFLRLQEEGEAELYAESIHGEEQTYGFPLF